MKEKTMLLLLVAYNNRTDVSDFIESLRASDSSSLIRFAVCDNSETADLSWDLGADVALCHRPDNPGYLDGARAAMNAYRANGNPATSWTVLANTDLHLIDVPAWFAILDEHDAAQSLILAPRITEGPKRVEKNPHLLEPRSRRRHRLNRIATRTAPLALIYLVAAWIRGRFQTRVKNDHATSQQIDASSGTRFYSPYGAFILFSEAFMATSGLPEGVPLLAEEYAIAETAAASQTPVVFEPRLRIIHEAHAVTGAKVSYGRAKMLTRAFKYIDDYERAKHHRAD